MLKPFVFNGTPVKYTYHVNSFRFGMNDEVISLKKRKNCFDDTLIVHNSYETTRVYGFTFRSLSITHSVEIKQIFVFKLNKLATSIQTF